MDEAAELNLSLPQPVPNPQPLGPGALSRRHAPRHAGLTGALEVLRPSCEPLRVAEVPADFTAFAQPFEGVGFDGHIKILTVHLLCFLI